MAAHDQGQYRIPRPTDVHPDDVLPPREKPEGRHHPSEGPLTTKPKLRLVDGETGEILCMDCQREREEKRILAQELSEAEGELRRYRTMVSRLQNAAAKERAEHPRRTEIKNVFVDWQEKTGHPNAKLTDDRFDALEKWLKHYSADQISWACAYVGEYPYLKPNGYGERQQFPAPGGNKAKDRKDDLVYLCADAGRFEKFANLGYQLLRSQNKIAAQSLFS